jgi:hypothetical protein
MIFSRVSNMTYGYSLCCSCAVLDPAPLPSVSVMKVEIITIFLRYGSTVAYESTREVVVPYISSKRCPNSLSAAGTVTFGVSEPLSDKK